MQTKWLKSWLAIFIISLFFTVMVYKLSCSTKFAFGEVHQKKQLFLYCLLPGNAAVPNIHLGMTCLMQVQHYCAYILLSYAQIDGRLSLMLKLHTSLLKKSACVTTRRLRNSHHWTTHTTWAFAISFPQIPIYGLVAVKLSQNSFNVPLF